MTTPAAADQATPGIGIPFTVASRAQSRFSKTQTVDILSGAGNFDVVQLPATGWVRAIELVFTASYTTSASAAVVAGDSPWNLISQLTLTDSTGTPIIQPVTGYNLFLANKYLDTGWIAERCGYDPRMDPEFAYAATGTSGSAVFRLFLVLEEDSKTGYGCIPNLDSNASLQIRTNYAASTVAFTGGTASAATLQMKVIQHYWAPTARTAGGVAVASAPPGAGDYFETRYENQTVTAQAQNLQQLVNRGGLIKGILLVSRASGARVALPTSNDEIFDVRLDNQPIYEGVPLASHFYKVRKMYDLHGANETNSYTPLTGGTISGLEDGVIPVPFFKEAGYRDGWLNTRVGSLLEVRLTPGASATQLEALTRMGVVKDAAAFMSRGM